MVLSQAVHFFLLPLLCLGASSAFAEDRVVKVGVYENEPKVFTDTSGRPAAIFIDIIEHIAKKEGWILRYVAWHMGRGARPCGTGRNRSCRTWLIRWSGIRYTLFTRCRSCRHVSGICTQRKRCPVDSRPEREADLVLERSVQQAAFVQLSKGFGLKQLRSFRPGLQDHV